MNNIESSLIQIFKDNRPEYNEERYSIVVNQVFRTSAVPSLIKCLKKNKFSGKCGKFNNIADVKMWKIAVYDTTLPEQVKSNAIENMDVKFADIENLLEVSEVLALLEEINESSQAEQLRRSVTETTAERTFSNTFSNENTKAVSINIPLALDTKEGTYSIADKEFFSWWARDSSKNIYLRDKDGNLHIVPLKEGAEPSIRNDSEFWGIFWKSYRKKIIEIHDKVIEYAWSLKDSIDEADLDENRLRKKIDPKEKRSIVSMIHQFVPKSWMNRLCLTLNIDQIDEYDEGGKKIGSQRFFKGFTLGFFPDGYVSNNPQPPTDDNWMRMLSKAVPFLELNELEEAQRFTNHSKVLAINTLQLGAFLPKTIGEVPDLPKAWDKFFANRLGKNYSSQMYRIAKWVVGVLDEKNFGRRVLVVAGHGADGKSIFQNVLLKGFNDLLHSRNFAKILPIGAINPENTQNGLLPCMDSRVLFTADVTKVTDYLKSEVIKNITGLDEVTAQVKFAQPVTKSMAGVKLMVTTNSPTYLSDNYVDTRVSPIYFERADRDEADWDAYEVKMNMIAEFPEFVRWCFAFAYAQDAALNAPIHGDPKIWSDTGIEGDIRSQWEALGSDNGGEPMFKFRKMDANSDILMEDILYKLDDLFYSDPEGFLPVGKIREVISNAVGIKFRDAGADARWSQTRKLILERFNLTEQDITKSNGIRIIRRIGLKSTPIAPSSRRSAVPDSLSTQLPYGLNKRT